MGEITRVRIIWLITIALCGVLISASYMDWDEVIIEYLLSLWR